jgi:hypothetical protein
VLDRVRDAKAATEAAGTAHIETTDARGMTLAGGIDFRTRSGRLEGRFGEPAMTKPPADFAEKLAAESSPAFGTAMAGMFGQIGKAMEAFRTMQPVIEYAVVDGELFHAAGGQMVPATIAGNPFGSTAPWQDDLFWVLDVLPSATAARPAGDVIAIEIDLIAAGESVDRPLRLPSATLKELRAFPAEVALDDQGRARRMACGGWTAELRDFGV